MLLNRIEILLVEGIYFLGQFLFIHLYQQYQRLR